MCSAKRPKSFQPLDPQMVSQAKDVYVLYDVLLKSKQLIASVKPFSVISVF